MNKQLATKAATILESANNKDQAPFPCSKCGTLQMLPEASPNRVASR